MDHELKELANLALINAFWRDYGGLIEAYLKVAEELDKETFLLQMQEHTSVFSRSEEETDHFINLHGTWKGEFGLTGSCGYGNFVEAFGDERAQELYLQGERIFCRDEAGEWVWCGDDE